MTAKTIDFDISELAQGGCPRTDLGLIGPGGPMGTRANFSQVLLDTGATHTQLPEDVALDIGIDPGQGSTVAITTANGTAWRQHLTVDLEVAGVSVNVDVYFAQGATPLIGRSSLYAAFAATGFEPGEWLQKL